MPRGDQEHGFASIHNLPVVKVLWLQGLAMTMEERNRASEVRASIAKTDAFYIAALSWQQYFVEAPIPVVQQIESNWQADDLATIRDILTGWFG